MVFKTTFPCLFKSETNSIEAEDNSSRFCYAPWRMLRIRWNGIVQPCDLWGGGGIGDLRNNTFKEIWNNKEYSCLRRDLTEFNYRHSKCSLCNMVTTDNVEGKIKKKALVNTSE